VDAIPNPSVWVDANRYRNLTLTRSRWMQNPSSVWVGAIPNPPVEQCKQIQKPDPNQAQVDAIPNPSVWVDANRYRNLTLTRSRWMQALNPYVRLLLLPTCPSKALTTY